MNSQSSTSTSMSNASTLYHLMHLFHIPNAPSTLSAGNVRAPCKNVSRGELITRFHCASSSLVGPDSLIPAIQYGPFARQIPAC